MPDIPAPGGLGGAPMNTLSTFNEGRLDFRPLEIATGCDAGFVARMKMAWTS
jgi:hypothetical protein